MEYGFIVKHRKESVDTPLLFFIFYMDENKIVLIPSHEPTQPVEIPRSEETDYIIVYQPQARGVCGIKRLNLNQTIRITYPDKVREGKIIKKKDDTISVRFFSEQNSPIEVFNFNYHGLDENMVNIESLDNEKEYIVDKNEKVLVETNAFSPNVNANETVPKTYYYSMEQQVQELLEELTKHIDVKEYTLLQEINTLIARYIEINEKYYNYDNNYTFKPLTNRPILERIRAGDSIFDYVSENLSVRYFTEYEHTPKDKIELTRIKDRIDPNFPPRSEMTFILDSNTTQHKTYSEVLRINDTYIETLHIDFEPDQTLYYGGKPIHVLLNAIDVKEEMKRTLYHGEIYSILTESEIPLDGIVVPSIQTLNESMVSGKMTTLLNKISPTNYLLNNYVLGSKPLTFTENTQIIYKDKTFYPFLNEVAPDIKDILPHLRSKLYNIYDYIKHCSLFHIYEINASQYKTIYTLVKSNIGWFKTFKSHRMAKAKSYTSNHFFLNSLKKPYLNESYYSSSEMFHMSVSEDHLMLLYDLYSRLNETSVKELLGQLDVNARLPMQYDKIYETTAELESDVYPMFKDLTPNNDPLFETETSFKPSIQLLWDSTSIDTSRYKDIQTFETSIKNYLKSMDKTTDPLFKDDSKIQEWYAIYRIESGRIGYVRENRSTFVMKNKQWVPYVESALSTRPSQNTSLNKQILDLNKPPPRPPREQVVRRIQFLHIGNMSFFKKYNDMKKIYSNQYISTGVVVSPHHEVFESILVVDPLEERMKLIRHFCELYTIEGPDPNWLYCIDSGSKLVPLFLKKLAYVNIEHHQETIDQICFEQGEQQDEYWVDKFSGYTIKKINFNDEEGFTSDGFKIKSRAILDDRPVPTLTESETDISTILKAMGLTYEPISHISNELESIKKKFKKYDIIILYAVLFIFIQGNIDTRQTKASFYSCKTSFSGFPAVNDETATSGIEYMLCVHKTLTNKKKVYKKENFMDLIRTCLEHSPTLKLKLSSAPNQTEPEIQVSPSWDLFLPRLTPITIKKNQSRYYMLFEFQRLIHDYVNTQEPNIKLSNGQFKTINSYSGIQNGEYSLPETVRSIVRMASPKPHFFLQYYTVDTKVPDKFKLPALVYSAEKIRRILQKDPGDMELSEQNKQIQKILENKRVWKEPVLIVEKKKASLLLSPEQLKIYKKKVEEYSMAFHKSKLVKLFDNLKTTGERDSYVHMIFKNLWNDLIMISYMSKGLYTYSNPELRKKLKSLLHPKHLEKLLHIISHTYEDLFIPSEVYGMVPPDIEEYTIAQKNIIYKYALCEAYTRAEHVSKKKMDKYMDSILTHLNINIKKIETNNEKEKRKEKKDITDMFKSQNENDRKAEYLMKTHKLGKWHVGTEVFKYKATAYDWDAPVDVNNPSEPLDNVEEQTEYEEYNKSENEE